MTAATAHPLRAMLWRIVSDRFLLGILGAIGIAVLLPDLGRSGGWLALDHVGDAGIALIFFLHGLNLSPASLKAGALRWPVHCTVQTMTFLVFPLLYLALRPLLGGIFPEALVLGFCYLCVLPSTISSSVAMTSLARGNVPAAIFNASLSSLLGIVLTPLWVGLLAQSGGHTLEFGPAVLGIAKMLLLPMVVGQLLRPWLGGWAKRNKSWLSTLDRTVILCLVLTAFSDSIEAGVWHSTGPGTLVAAALVVLGLLAVVLFLGRIAARRLGFSREDEIVLVFCGSKKTLASGVPMAKLLFGAMPSLSLVVLPIMLYHQIQLIVCGFLASRYAEQAERANTAG